MPALFPTRAFRRTRERASGLLFAFGVDDLSPSLVTGHTLTFARASGRTVLDSTGRIATLAHSQIPWSAVYNATDAVWEPTLDLQKDVGNYVKQSENFGTTWVAIGTPTRTAAAWKCGDLSLDLLGDDAAGTLEGYSQVVAPSGGDGPKGISIFLRAGTSTSTVIRYRDTTAAANRLLATITWASGVPTVTMTTGSNLGTVTCAGGVYRFQFSCTTITSANANQLELYPATTAALAVANTGTVYAGGAQIEGDHHTHAYVRTTTATVFTSADVPYAGLDWLPQDFTLYARLARPAWMGAALTIDYANIVCAVRAASGAVFGLSCNTVNRTFVATISDGTTPRTQTVAIPSTSMVEACVQFTNVPTAGTTRLDVGAGFGAASSATGAIGAWGGATLGIGASLSGTLQLDGGIRKLLLASGARTLAEMRGLST